VRKPLFFSFLSFLEALVIVRSFLLIKPCPAASPYEKKKRFKDLSHSASLSNGLAIIYLQCLSQPKLPCLYIMQSESPGAYWKLG